METFFFFVVWFIVGLIGSFSYNYMDRHGKHWYFKKDLQPITIRETIICILASPLGAIALLATFILSVNILIYALEDDAWFKQPLSSLFKKKEQDQ